MTPIELSARPGGGVCPYCRDPLAPPLVVCPGCRVAMHSACARELDRCVTLGCVRRARRPPARQVGPDTAERYRTAGVVLLVALSLGLTLWAMHDSAQVQMARLDSPVEATERPTAPGGRALAEEPEPQAAGEPRGGGERGSAAERPGRPAPAAPAADAATRSRPGPTEPPRTETPPLGETWGVEPSPAELLWAVLVTGTVGRPPALPPEVFGYALTGDGGVEEVALEPDARLRAIRLHVGDLTVVRVWGRGDLDALDWAGLTDLVGGHQPAPAVTAGAEVRGRQAVVARFDGLRSREELEDALASCWPGLPGGAEPLRYAAFAHGGVAEAWARGQEGRFVQSSRDAFERSVGLLASPREGLRAERRGDHGIRVWMPELVVEFLIEERGVWVCFGPRESVSDGWLDRLRGPPWAPRGASRD